MENQKLKFDLDERAFQAKAAEREFEDRTRAKVQGLSTTIEEMTRKLEELQRAYQQEREQKAKILQEQEFLVDKYNQVRSRVDVIMSLKSVCLSV